MPSLRTLRTGRKLWLRAAQSALLSIAAVVMLGANESRYDRLGHAMICMCGCSQILNECNHVGCPVSPVMLAELKDQIAAGGSDTAVLNWFAAKYGAIALASPMRGGFDTVAWVMPIAVFVLATLGTAAIVWFWRRRSVRLGTAGAAAALNPYPFAIPASDPESEALRERIRRETEYR